MPGARRGAGALAGAAAARAVEFYRKFLSPLHSPTCRFYPSCSAYALEAFQTLGFWRAAGLTALRILKCQPLHPGGYDPVPGPTATRCECSRGG